MTSAVPGPGTESTTAQRLSILWQFARPHRRTIAVGIGLGLVATAAALATPLVTKAVLDSVGGAASLLTPISLLLGLIVISGVASLAQHVILGRLAEDIVLDARVSLLTRFFRARLLQIQRFRTGELVTRITSDTVLLREATSNSVVHIVNGLVSLVGTVVLMAVLDLPLLGATFTALVVVAITMMWLMPKIGRAEKRAQDSLGELGGTVEGGIQALRTVKAARAEEREIARAREFAFASRTHAVRSVWISGLAWTIAGTGIQLAIIAILGIGAWRVSLDAMSVSTLVAFLLYAFNIIEPVSTLTMAFTSLQSGMAAAARIFETQHLRLEDIEAVPTAKLNPGAGTAAADVALTHPAALASPADPNLPVIEFRQVTAAYDGNAPALEHVDLAIGRTGHTALVGPSGAGKTTVLSLMLRFLTPTSGEIYLDGRPYSQLSLEAVRARIAYVEQETPVLPGTIGDNVAFRAPEAAPSELWAALEGVQLAEKVRSLPQGLDTPISATTLSGGERQRLAVARALVRPPRILLLDEATAQLDGITEAAIQHIIAEAAKTGAVVTIAHRLSTVIDADRIVVMEGGTIRSQGSHAELMRTDELYQQFISALRIAA